jgi:hypothetical protein
MSVRRLLLLILTASLLAACGSSSSPTSIGDLCDRYANAVKQIVPTSLPLGVPGDFGPKLAAQASRSCVQQAVKLGYGGSNGHPRHTLITYAQASRLVHDLTDGTAVHVSP